MAKYKSKGVRSEKKERIVKVSHDNWSSWGRECAFFPMGYKYNEELQSLRRGDKIQFLDGTRVVVDSIVRLGIRTAIAESLCRARYGFGIKRALEIWKSRIEAMKMDARVISENECLVIFYYGEGENS